MTDRKVVIKAKAKTKSKRNAERPEIRIFNDGKFNNDTNGDKEIFRNLKSSSISSLKMERTSETSCKVFVGFVGYTNVEGDKKDDKGSDTGGDIIRMANNVVRLHQWSTDTGRNTNTSTSTST